METHEDDNISVFLRGGASIVTVKPIISPDGKYVICASGELIKVLSILSGECVNTLIGHRYAVTSIKTNPANQFQIYSCSTDHTVIKWSYVDGIMLKKYQFAYPLYGLFPTREGSTFLATVQKAKVFYQLVSFHFPQKVTKKVSTDVIFNKIWREERFTTVGHNGDYVVSCLPRQMLIHSFVKNTQKEHNIDKGHNFTCVACHPTEYCIATGHTDGQIWLWRNIFNSEKVVKTTMHWHALPVRCLSFTTEGSYLLSGGHECVMVKWQHNSTHKDTLPRLGAPLVGVVPSKDNTLYATCHSDNVIQIISSQFKVLQVFQGLTRGHLDQQTQTPVSTGMLLDPRTKALVMNGRPGHLQFYSLHNDKQLYNLDIVCQNYISPENLKRPTFVTDVDKAAFDESGRWLATVESRDDKETSIEIRLKFWEYQDDSQKYTLNTSVELPHSERIHTVQFRPRNKNRKEASPMVVTTSSEGKFKLWSLQDDTDIYRENQCWTCESVGFYRDLPAGPAAFSEDGDLLAVAFGNNITLWNPDTNALRLTFSAGTSNETIKHLLFGSHMAAAYLVTATQCHITSWNLLTCAAQWSIPCKTNILIQDPCSDYMAAFIEEKDLMVFKPSSKEPVYKQTGLTRSIVLNALFVPHKVESGHYKDGMLSWQNKSQLYFMNKYQELFTISYQDKSSTEEIEGKQNEPLVQNLPQTPFSILMAKNRKRGIENEEKHHLEGHQGHPGHAFLKEMLSIPAHVLPPVQSLCSSFMDSLVLKKKGSMHKEMDSSDDEEDDNMENESDSSESEMEIDEAPKSKREQSKNRNELDSLPIHSFTEKVVENQKTEEFRNISIGHFDWLEEYS